MYFKQSIVLVLLFSGTSFAQKTMPTVLGSTNAQDTQRPAAKLPLNFTKGVVRNVDQQTKMITLAHREIKNLGMPPMTMVFHVKDLAMLGEVKAGDQVLFKAKRIGGTLFLTEIHVTAAIVGILAPVALLG